jgi:hypothetical protein
MKAAKSPATPLLRTTAICQPFLSQSGTRDCRLISTTIQSNLGCAMVVSHGPRYERRGAVAAEVCDQGALRPPSFAPNRTVGPDAVHFDRIKGVERLEVDA